MSKRGRARRPPQQVPASPASKSPQAAKSKAALTPASVPDAIWHSITQRIGARGAKYLAVAVCVVSIFIPKVLGLWDWLRPPVSRWVASQMPVPQFSKDHVGVAILWLEHDEGDRAREILLHEFGRSVKGLEVRPIQRMISTELDRLPDSVAAGHKYARQLLKDTGAALVLWGKVLQSGDQRALELYLTPSDACSLPKDGRYSFREGLQVPEEFWSDVGSFLALLACSEAAQVSDYELATPKLIRLVSRLGPLVDNAGWNPRSRRTMARLVAEALMRLGEQDTSGSVPLLAAQQAYGSLATEQLQRENPTLWASDQLNLGIIGFRLASRDPSRWRMDAALENLRAALNVHEGLKDRAGVAAVKATLGSALSMLGRQKRQAGPIHDAVEVLEGASKDYEALGNRLDWAQAQINLGNAHSRLAAVDHDSRILERAVIAYRNAAAPDIRQRSAAVWARAQVNLAGTLCDAVVNAPPAAGLTLRRRESNAPLLAEAVSVAREALTVLTRENQPALWSMAQHNLGRALEVTGSRGDGTAELEEGVISYRLALSAMSAEGDRDGWLDVQHDRVTALTLLAARKLDRSSIDEAIDAARNSISVAGPDWPERAEVLGRLEYAERLRRWIDCRCGIRPRLR